LDNGCAGELTIRQNMYEARVKPWLLPETAQALGFDISFHCFSSRSIHSGTFLPEHRHCHRPGLGCAQGVSARRYCGSVYPADWPRTSRLETTGSERQTYAANLAGEEAPCSRPLYIQFLMNLGRQCYTAAIS